LFTKILIANRGEIACRIIKTASSMGIKTVAVYSEADADARHVRLANEAVFIGPAASGESYLAAHRIIDAVVQTKAQAVHPGYGFLSENTDFAASVSAVGAVFIGPSLDAIAAMGDKIQSKKIAQQAGLNVIPGYLGEVKDPNQAIGIARDIGYPVMIKASSGGGGKGMRIARDDEALRRGFPLAQSEAQTSFGDGRLLIESYIEQPRHIEIQVLGDSHGNIIHLNERECSIQRRHQKVIEEAPSPFVDSDLRAAMGEQAIKLARKVNYHSAGTVEFIVGSDKQFYFLEMNTRLQVEHPVTEMITGFDLVEQMIRISAGEPLSVQQTDVHIQGWAVEARVYAEDPERGFLPSTGRLTRYVPPDLSDSVRFENGVEEGDEVSVFYDPMIAKVVTHGPDRETAIARSVMALDSFVIRGVSNNISFLCSVLDRARFRKGFLTTDFINEEYPDGFNPIEMTNSVREVLIGVAALAHVCETARMTKISGRTDGGRYRPSSDWVVSIGNEECAIAINPTDGGCHIFLEGAPLQVQGNWMLGSHLFTGEVNGRTVNVQIDRLVEGYCLTHRGTTTQVVIRDTRAAALTAQMLEKLPPDMSRYVLSPMPGRVVSISIQPGDFVKAGEELLVIDAMKMENVLCAERDGTVADVRVAAGDSLSVDQVILELEPTATA